MELVEEICLLKLDLARELQEIRKLLMPIALYCAEKLKEEKNG